MGESRGIYWVLEGKPKGKKTTWKNQAQMGGIILRWIFRNWAVRLWTCSSWLRTDTGGRHLQMW